MTTAPCAEATTAGLPGPVRTCIGCRRKRRATELLRVVAVDGVVIPDLRRSLPGRGAWLHPDQGCLDLAERRRAFGRALRLAGHPDTSKVRQLLDPGERAGPADRIVPESGSRSRSPVPPEKEAGRPNVSTP